MLLTWQVHCHRPVPGRSQECHCWHVVLPRCRASLWTVEEQDGLAAGWDVEAREALTIWHGYSLVKRREYIRAHLLTSSLSNHDFYGELIDDDVCQVVVNVLLEIWRHRAGVDVDLVPSNFGGTVVYVSVYKYKCSINNKQRFWLLCKLTQYLRWSPEIHLSFVQRPLIGSRWQGRQQLRPWEGIVALKKRTYRYMANLKK